MTPERSESAKDKTWEWKKTEPAALWKGEVLIGAAGFEGESSDGKIQSALLGKLFYHTELEQSGTAGWSYAYVGRGEFASFQNSHLSIGLGHSFTSWLRSDFNYVWQNEGAKAFGVRLFTSETFQSEMWSFIPQLGLGFFTLNGESQRESGTLVPIYLILESQREISKTLTFVGALQAEWKIDAVDFPDQSISGKAGLLF